MTTIIYLITGPRVWPHVTMYPSSHQIIKTAFSGCRIRPEVAVTSMTRFAITMVMMNPMNVMQTGRDAIMLVLTHKKVAVSGRESARVRELYIDNDTIYDELLNP